MLTGVALTLVGAPTIDDISCLVCENIFPQIQRLSETACRKNTLTMAQIPVQTIHRDPQLLYVTELSSVVLPASVAC